MKYLIYRINEWTIIATVLLFFQPANMTGQELLTSDVKPGQFVSIVHGDGARTGLNLDLRLLPGFFERAYLLELIFQVPDVVVIETSLTSDFLPLVAISAKELSVVISNLEDLKRKAIEAGRILPAGTQKELMEKYEKFR